MKIAIALLFIISAASTHAADVAKINFDRIKGPLTELVLAKPQNAELKAKFDALPPEDPMAIMEGMDFSTNEDGEFEFNLDSDFMAKMMKESMNDDGRMAVELEIDELLPRELILLIDDLDETYGIVIRASGRYGGSDTNILYATVEIEDITQKLYQIIVRKLAEKTKAAVSPASLAPTERTEIRTNAAALSHSDYASKRGPKPANQEGPPA